MALLVSVFMAIMALPFVVKFSSRMRITEKSFGSLAALNLAEAGLERAIWELNSGDISSWSVSGTNQRTLNISNFTASNGAVIGNISTTVYDPQGLAPVIESTGTAVHIGSPSVSKTLRVVLEGGAPAPLFNFGLFGGTGGVNIGSGAVIDSYDSRLGAYGGTNVHDGGNIGTNSDIYGAINVGNNSVIKGDAMTGTGSDPNEIIIQGMGSDITGEEVALDDPKVLPSVPVPTGLVNRGPLSAKGTTKISQSGQYSNFTLANNALVEITANVTLYITGAFTLNNGAEFRIDSGCSVTIYFGGSWSLDSGCMINNKNQDPTKLVMLGTDTFSGSKTFRNSFVTYAAMYFPNANINFANLAAIYGSIIANQFMIGNNMQVHYDEALASLQIGLSSGTSAFEVRSWQERII